MSVLWRCHHSTIVPTQELTYDFISHLMDTWAEREAETIIDAFVAYEGPDDLLRLQHAIAAALHRAFEIGCRGKMPDMPLDLQ